MRQKYCVISGMKSKLLKELVLEVVADNPDYRMVNIARSKVDHSQVTEGVGVALEPDFDWVPVSIDLVICELRDQVIPSQIQDLFTRNKKVVVAGLVNDGRQLALFSNNTGLDAFKQILALQADLE